MFNVVVCSNVGVRSVFPKMRIPDPIVKKE
jgi:hypothetical protein